jgi:hypothetical protein
MWAVIAPSPTSQARLPYCSILRQQRNSGQVGAPSNVMTVSRRSAQVDRLLLMAVLEECVPHQFGLLEQQTPRPDALV